MSTLQDRIQHSVAQLDRELSKYHVLNNLEKSSSIPKAYAVSGLVILYSFFILFNFGGQLLTNVAGFVIPGYYSLEALFSANQADDKQWLTYWVVFAFLTVFESLVNAIYWFPFYYTFKYVFLLWLSLPAFRGADIIFNSLAEPMLGRYFSKGSTATNLRAKSSAIHSE